MAPEYNIWGQGWLRRGSYKDREGGSEDCSASIQRVTAAESQMSPGPFVLLCVSVPNNKSGAPVLGT